VSVWSPLANFHPSLKNSRNLTDKFTNLGKKSVVENSREAKNYFLHATFRRIQLGSVWLCNFVITTAPVFLASRHREGREAYYREGEKKRTTIL